MSKISRIVRAVLVALCLAVVPAFIANPAEAATPAETFVSTDIAAGIAILQNPALSPAERSNQFETFLLGITDLKRVALFTLGDRAAAASPAEQDAFVAAFRNYAVGIYRSYFQLYSGQTLSVTGSQARSPDDVIVSTSMMGLPGGAPMKIDFRVRLDGPAPVITDIGIAGAWLALAQRDDFAGFLNQHKGDVAALTAHLNEAARGFAQ